MANVLCEWMSKCSSYNVMPIFSRTLEALYPIFRTMIWTLADITVLKLLRSSSRPFKVLFLATNVAGGCEALVLREVTE